MQEMSLQITTELQHKHLTIIDVMKEENKIMDIPLDDKLVKKMTNIQKKRGVTYFIKPDIQRLTVQVRNNKKRCTLKIVMKDVAEEQEGAITKLANYNLVVQRDDT